MLYTQSTRRLLVLLWVILTWVVVIFGRLVWLQVVDHDELLAAANRQQQRTVAIPALRGSVLDRSGQPLAKTLEVDSIAVDPQLVEDPEEASKLLAWILQIDAERLRDRLAQNKADNLRFMWVKRKLSPAEGSYVRAQVSEHKLNYVEFRQEKQRYYPHATLAAHVLGSLGHLETKESRERRKLDSKAPVETREQGNAGIEQVFERELAGEPGLAREYTDVHHNPYRSEVLEEPVPGADLILTIDPNVQYEAERQLRDAVTDSGAKSGSVVAIDPYTGDILALANYPTFDPNVPPGREGESPGARNNRAISTPFEPGSVLKVMTMAAALDRTDLRPNSMIFCGNGEINLFGRTIHDDHKYDWLTMADVLAHSSNIGAINVALEVGEEGLYDVERQFGFGQLTGIGLPGESTGKLYALDEWERSSIGSVAIGHEVSVTSIQLAQAGAAIANGGIRVKPRLVAGRQYPGRKQEMFAPEAGARILRPETAIDLRQMMEGVVLSGTGSRAVVPGYTSGGKTGSAQVWSAELGTYTHTYNASFLGFAPVANPRVVIAVTLHETTGGTTGYGGVRAAPVFRGVALSAMRMLGVPQDLPGVDVKVISNTPVESDLAIAGLGTPPPGLFSNSARNASVANATGARNRSVSSVTQPPVPAGSSASAGDSQRDRRPFLDEGFGSGVSPTVVGPTTPDFTGMTLRAVLRSSSSMGLEVEVHGSGLARSQDPPAGEALPKRGPVRVLFDQ